MLAVHFKVDFEEDDLEYDYPKVFRGLVENMFAGRKGKLEANEIAKAFLAERFDLTAFINDAFGI